MVAVVFVEVVLTSSVVAYVVIVALVLVTVVLVAATLAHVPIMLVPVTDVVLMPVVTVVEACVAVAREPVTEGGRGGRRETANGMCMRIAVLISRNCTCSCQPASPASTRLLHMLPHTVCGILFDL